MRLVLLLLPLVPLAVALPRASRASAPEEPRLTYEQALGMARAHAPQLAVARGREAVARTEVRAAGVYPNPTISAGTTTQAARMVFGATVPLVVLGQRGAAIDAGRAELGAVVIDTEIAAADVRAAAARSFVALWAAEHSAEARGEASTVTARLEDVVRARVEVGAAPELEGLRAHAERLRADSDAQAAHQLVNAAAADFGRWIGIATPALRVQGDPMTPAAPPPFSSLAARVVGGPSVRREEADARAADARAARERALVRPTLMLDLGVEAYDPALPAPNYRAQLGLEVPLFNQRGPLIERELLGATVARLRATAEVSTRTADLMVAYETFVALTNRTKVLEEGVVPAAEAAAKATEESYTLGRAGLVNVLDAEHALIDAKLNLLEAKAARANAWIDAERAVGEQ